MVSELASEIETAIVLIKSALCVGVFVLIARRFKAMYFEIREKIEESRRDAKRNN